MLSLEQRKKRLSRWMAVGLIGAAGLIVAPVIFLVVKGLAGLVVAAVMGLAVVNFAPVVAMKFANWKLKAVKAEARSNPIETLQNLLVQKKAELDRFSASITDFSTQVRAFEGKVEEFSIKYPNKAADFRDQLAKMRALLEHRKQLYKEAKAQVELFVDKVKESAALWDMSQAAQAMNLAAGQQVEDPMESIKAETAIDSVEESMNRSFAQLETALLENTPSNVIDITPIKVGVAR